MTIPDFHKCHFTIIKSIITDLWKYLTSEFLTVFRTKYTVLESHIFKFVRKLISQEVCIELLTLDFLGSYTHPFQAVPCQNLQLPPGTVPQKAIISFHQLTKQEPN